jgi:hypothetical protein
LALSATVELNRRETDVGISLDDCLLAGENVLFRQLDAEAVLLDLKSGTYFGLNDVGARAWELILEHGRLSRVLEVLQREYAAEPDVVERDLLELAGQLVSEKLAQVKPNG